LDLTECCVRLNGLDTKHLGQTYLVYKSNGRFACDNPIAVGGNTKRHHTHRLCLISLEYCLDRLFKEVSGLWSHPTAREQFSNNYHVHERCRINTLHCSRILRFSPRLCLISLEYCLDGLFKEVSGLWSHPTAREQFSNDYHVRERCRINALHCSRVLRFSPSARIAALALLATILKLIVDISRRNIKPISTSLVLSTA